MNTKTKLALAAALVVGTTSLAAADGYDPNLANRYPALANPVAASAHQSRALRSAPVGLYQGRNAYQSRNNQLNTQRGFGASQEDPISVDAHDHASSPYAGGGF